MPKVTVDLRFKGGPGSGHRGHRGRPGVRGGSLPGMGLSPQQKLERTLDTNNIEISPTDKDHAEGSFKSDLVDIEGDDRGILKPRPAKREESLWEGVIRAPEREVLAYEVAKSMGYDDLVPVTIMREDRDASLQAWVEDSKTVYSGGWPGVAEEDVRRLAILDTIIGNDDRHEGNVIVSDVGVMYAIDHGLTFSTYTSTPGYTFARSSAVRSWLSSSGGGIMGTPKFSTGTKLTNSERASVQGFLSNVDLLSSISRQLGTQEVDAAKSRALWLLDNGLDMEYK